MRVELPLSFVSLSHRGVEVKGLGLCMDRVVSSTTTYLPRYCVGCCCHVGERGSSHDRALSHFICRGNKHFKYLAVQHQCSVLFRFGRGHQPLRCHLFLIVFITTFFSFLVVKVPSVYLNAPNVSNTSSSASSNPSSPSTITLNLFAIPTTAPIE